MTSLNRLFIQLWPVFLLAVFMVAGDDEGGTNRAVGISPSGKGRKGQAK